MTCFIFHEGLENLIIIMMLTVMRWRMVTITGRYEVAGHEAIIGGGHVVLGVTMGGGGPGHWGGHRGVVSRAN